MQDIGLPQDRKEGFEGRLDDVRFDSRALSVDEVDRLSKALPPFDAKVGELPNAAVSSSLIARESMALIYTDAVSSWVDIAFLKVKVGAQDALPDIKSGADGKTIITYVL